MHKSAYIKAYIYMCVPMCKIYSASTKALKRPYNYCHYWYCALLLNALPDLQD